MKYYNENDGKIYDTVEELEAAENERKKAEEDKRKRAKEKEARIQEVKEAYDYYYKLAQKYNKDYKDAIPLNYIFKHFLDF